MAKRFLAAAIGVPMIIAVVIFGVYAPILYEISVAIICTVSVGEFALATNTHRLLQLSIPSLLFAAAYPMLLAHGFGPLCCFVYGFIAMCMMVFFHQKISYKQFAYIFSMTTIITVALSTMVTMIYSDLAHSSFYFIFCLGLPWMADIGAFFAGTFLGRHKLCPEISPKKTIEGAVGGIIFCIGATCLIGWIFAALIYQGGITVNYVELCCLAFIGSLVSIMGDLCFSIIKRNFQIKDYGFILPGHGGFLDRFDSVIFVSPLILMFISYFPIISA